MRKKHALAIMLHQAELLDAARAALKMCLKPEASDARSDYPAEAVLVLGKIEEHLAAHPGMMFTTDTHRLAPYPGMTEEELLDFEKDMNMPVDKNKKDGARSGDGS